MAKNKKEYDGLPLRDATEPKAVTVSGRDFRKALLRDPEACVVALACSRKKEILDGRIGASTVYLRLRDNPKEWVRYKLRPADRRRIRKFDDESLDREAIATWLGKDTTIEFVFKPFQRSRRLDSRAGQQSGSHVRGTGQKSHIRSNGPRGGQNLRHLLYDVKEEEVEA